MSTALTIVALLAVGLTYWWAALWISARWHWTKALDSFNEAHGHRRENKTKATMWLTQMRWGTFVAAIQSWLLLILLLAVPRE